MDVNAYTVLLAFITTLPAILASLGALIASLRNARKIDQVHEEVKRDTARTSEEAQLVKNDVATARTAVKKEMEAAATVVNESLEVIRKQGKDIHEQVNGTRLQMFRDMAALARKVAELSKNAADWAEADRLGAAADVQERLVQGLKK